MKKILLSILSFVSIIEANAQFNLSYSNHAPQIGDSYSVSAYDTTASLQIGLGANQTWDFSSSTTANAQNNATINYGSTLNNQNAPSGSNLIESKNLVTFYFKSASDKMEILGYNDATSSFRLTESEGISSRTWPYSYGNSINDEGNGTYSTTIQNLPPSGNITPEFNSKFSGYGTLTGPDGTVYQNVIQVIDTLVYGISFNPQPGITAGSGTNIISYKFYVEGEKFPVVNVITTYITQYAFSGMTVLSWNQMKTITVEQKVNEILANNNLNELATNQQIVSIYPNPTSNSITINEENIKSVEIIDLNGVMIKSYIGNINKINVEDLSNGIYTLKIVNTNNQSHITKMVKN